MLHVSLNVVVVKNIGSGRIIVHSLFCRQSRRLKALPHGHCGKVLGTSPVGEKVITALTPLDVES